MAIKIGCPMLKLAPGKAGNAKKHSGKIQGVLCEAWECGTDDHGAPYRMTKDPDYNQAATVNNTYVGVRNAYELGALIRQTAEDYSDARRAAGGRGLRKTAAIGYGVILKPPAEYVNGLSEAEQARFRDDLLDSFKAATKDIIDPDTINAVWQVDEVGGHWHIAGPALTPTGELNADAIVNPRTFTALNKTLPDEMRQRHWDVAECVNYDPDKAKDMTPTEREAYKRKAKAKRPASGQDSESYKRNQELKRMAAEVERLKQENQELKQENQELKDERDREAVVSMDRYLAHCDGMRQMSNGRTPGYYARKWYDDFERSLAMEQAPEHVEAVEHPGGSDVPGRIWGEAKPPDDGHRQGSRMVEDIRKPTGYGCGIGTYTV